MNFTGVTGGLCFRAITLGIDKGVTSDALPMRIQREPGCMTMTFEPRLPYQNTKPNYDQGLSKDMEKKRTSGCGSAVMSSFRALFLFAMWAFAVFRAHSVLLSDFKYDAPTCFGCGLSVK